MHEQETIMSKFRRPRCRGRARVRRVAIALLVIGTTASLVGKADAAYQDVVRADRPRAHWTLGERSGAAIDTTGHAPAKYVGAVARGEVGPPGLESDGAAGFGAAGARVRARDNRWL